MKGKAMDIYINLDHKSYKALEKAMREFKETVHTSVEGFYHKSIRLPVGDATFEFTGPAVKAPPVEEGPLDRRKGERRGYQRSFTDPVRQGHVRRNGNSNRRKNA